LFNMSKDEQIAQCGQLCCVTSDCDAWAVHEMYTAGWAKNCKNSSLPKGSDCCLLKRKGWRMEGTQPDCTSGGRSAAPTPPVPPPTPPTPPPTSPPPPTPIVNGGGNCTDDWDCSLGGDCKSSACVCDAQYTGDHCGVLRLRRTKLNNTLGSEGSSLHTWGGHGLEDPATGKWVGFFRCARYCALVRVTV
jgi:hypothetical protein